MLGSAKTILLQAKVLLVSSEHGRTAAARCGESRAHSPHLLSRTLAAPQSQDCFLVGVLPAYIVAADAGESLGPVCHRYPQGEYFGPFLSVDDK